MAALPPAGAVNGNGNGDGSPVAADHRRLERRLHFHAAVYVLLGASYLLRAAVDVPRLADSHAVAGLVLWTAAVALALLSVHLRRFPMAAMAAARLAQLGLRAFF